MKMTDDTFATLQDFAKDRMFQDEVKPLGYQDSFDACIAYNREQSIRNLR